MNKLDIFKGITEVAVSIGVGAIVGNAIKITTAPDTKNYKKVAIWFGGYVLSHMVSQVASNYAVNEIDKVADNVRTIFKGPQEEPTTAESEEGEKEEASVFVQYSKGHQPKAGYDQDVIDRNHQILIDEIYNPENQIKPTRKMPDTGPAFPNA